MPEGINLSPRAVGYWARVHQLTLAEVREHPTFSAALADRAVRDGAGAFVGDYNDRAAAEFREGWDEADAELLAERFAALEESLRDAYAEPAEDDCG